MHLVRFLVVGVALALIVGSAGLRAQSPTVPRPYRGLFGGDEEADSRKESFDLSLSGYGGFDSNVALAQSELFTPGSPIGFKAPVQSSDVYGATATLSYARRWERANFNVYGSANSASYPKVSTDFQTGYSAGVGFDAPITRRTSIEASGAFTRRPFYDLGDVFPTLPTVGEVGVPVSVPSLEFGLIPASSLQSYGVARVKRNFSARTSFDVFVTRAATMYNGGAYESLDTSDTRLGGEFNHEITRNMTLHLAYDYRIGQLGTRTEQRYHNNEVNAGVDYHRAYNLWHRTSFSFSTGSTLFANQPLQLVGVPSPTTPGLKTDSLITTNQAGATDFRVILTGTASLVWEFLRSWSARMQALRGVHYLDGFAAPAVENAVSFGVGGLATRRVQLWAGASYASGNIGWSTVQNNGYDSWNAYASADYALTRHMAAYAHYFYYNYGFQPGVVLPRGLTDHFERQGARVGVKAWVPLCRCH